MILAFLRAEAGSHRFANCFLPALTKAGLSRSELIDKGDPKNKSQNAIRRTILQAYRGFGQNRLLFQGFPDVVVWRRVEIEFADHVRLRYANKTTWVPLSDGTRLVTRLAEKVARGEVPSDPADHINAIQDLLTAGKQLPELIAAEGAESSLILVEGHCRATAYACLGWREGIPAFIASSPLLHRWHNF